MDTQAMTQTQTQRSGIWDLEADSQPINVVWGRLYTKNSKFKSLGIRLRPRLIFNKSTPDYYGTLFIAIALLANFDSYPSLIQ